MCTKVTWDSDGDEFVFYRGMQKQAIEVNLYPNENNELECQGYHQSARHSTKGRPQTLPPPRPLGLRVCQTLQRHAMQDPKKTQDTAERP